MSDFDTRPRRGSHRARRSLLSLLLPPLLALLAIVLVVGVAAWVWSGDDDSNTASATPTRSTTSAPTTARATPSVTATRPAAATTAASTPTAEQSSETPTPTSSATSGDDAGEFRSTTQVVVLNQSGISGLAGRLANRLRENGWTVSGLGNFTGTVPSTTVYYPEGLEDAAAALAADVPGPDRTRPRFGNLSTSRLTVVITEDFS